ncbi:MAG: hypothetical protein AB1730_14330 [Myxococcota bacterium]
MRHLLSLGLALAASGCSFYQPDLTDCVLPCPDAGSCPGGMACVEGLCRAAGRTEACECIAGKTRPCGSNVGACKQGFQECTREGTWGACTGGIEPTEEVCDGRDNDCDGRTDFTAAKLLMDDRRPFTTYETRLFGHPGGYALVYFGGTPDGGEGLLVQRYDARFEALGAPTVLHDGSWNRGYSAANDAVVVAMVNVDERVLAYATAMTPGAPGVTVLDLPDAGYERRGFVALSPDGGARVAWGTGASVRLADVDLSGGEPLVRDVPMPEDAGAIIDFALSSGGRYSLVQLDANPDGGTYLNFFLDNDTLDAGREGVFGYEYPFRRGRPWLQEVGGRLPYVSDWEDETGTTRVTYTYNLLDSDDGYDVLPPGTGRWAENAVTLLPDGDLLMAISDLRQQAIVLAKIHGTSFADYETVLRNLPENSGFGPPAVAVTPGDEMVGLVWTSTRGVYARRVCVPFIGD